MHIVFTVGTYYPLYSATGRCAKNLVDEMVKKYNVTVVAQRRWDSPKNTDNLELKEHLRYVSTGISDARAFVNKHINLVGSSKLWMLGSRLLAGLRYGEIFFSPTACHTSEVNAFLDELEKLDPKPDYLVPCSLPFEGVVACVLYKQKHPEVILTPIIFDQFSESATLLKTAHERHAKFKANVQLERMVAEVSDRVFTVTWDDHVANYLPDLANKFEHIEHPLLLHDNTFDMRINDIFGPGCHAVYAGALNVGVRNPRHLTQLFEGYAKREGVPLKLHAYCMGDGIEAVRIAQEKYPDDIDLRNPVPRDELLDAYASADVLVSVGNNIIDQKASKITEYMATGKPILHIACCDDDPVIPDIERYPLGLVLRTDVALEANQDALAEFVERTKGQRVPFTHVEELFPDEVPSNVCDLILRGGGYSCSQVICREL